MGHPVYFRWLGEYPFVLIKLEEKSLMALVAILTETNYYVTWTIIRVHDLERLLQRRSVISRNDLAFCFIRKYLQSCFIFKRH